MKKVKETEERKENSTERCEKSRKVRNRKAAELEDWLSVKACRRKERGKGGRKGGEM